jgi:outer membrane protein
VRVTTILAGAIFPGEWRQHRLDLFFRLCEIPAPPGPFRGSERAESASAGERRVKGSNSSAEPNAIEMQSAWQRSAYAVNRWMLTSAVVLGLAGASFFVGTVRGQNAAKAELPHKVGLIDMGQVFKEYKKFEALREDLRPEFQAVQEEEKGVAEKIEAAQKELASGAFKQGSPEFIEREQAITKQVAEFQALRTNHQKEMYRRESKIYHTVYHEVQDAVNKFCTTYKYTLVMRFSRDELSSDPQKLMQGLNKPVVFHQPEDDLTDSVIDYLNQKYARVAGAGGAKAPPAKTVKK